MYGFSVRPGLRCWATNNTPIAPRFLLDFEHRCLRAAETTDLCHTLQMYYIAPRAPHRFPRTGDHQPPPHILRVLHRSQGSAHVPRSEDRVQPHALDVLRRSQDSANVPRSEDQRPLTQALDVRHRSQDSTQVPRRRKHQHLRNAFSALHRSEGYAWASQTQDKDIGNCSWRLGQGKFNDFCRSKGVTERYVAIVAAPVFFGT